jgi:FkbM family methyltransferase
MIQTLKYYLPELWFALTKGRLYKQYASLWPDLLFFTVKLPLKRRFLFSDDNQELWLMYLLGKHFNQAYPESIVDIGANDPIKLNNTYFFEKLYQTRVYSFEPNRELLERWKSTRPDSEIQFVGISSTEDQLLLELPISEFMEGIDTHVFASLASEKSKLKQYALEQTRQIHVEVGPLAKYLAPAHYDALFIDTEGHELEVLRGIDFNVFQFKVVIIENNQQPGGNKQIRRLLGEAGYQRVMRSYRLDDYFVRKL